MKDIKNRTVFKIEYKKGKTKHHFNGKVNLSEGAIMYLLGDMTNLILGSFENKGEKATQQIFDKAIEILNSNNTIIISDFDVDFKYTYKEQNCEGFTKYAPFSISCITRLLHRYTHYKDKLSQASFLKASLSFYDFCSKNDIGWNELYFLTNKEIEIKYPLLKKDLPIGF